MKKFLIIGGIVIATILLVVFAIQSVQNKAISYEELILTAQSDIDVQQKARADLIPNLVDCVKEYDEYEYKTLMAIVEARGAESDEVSEEIQNKIDLVVEAYPELKSNENYQNLMKELALRENLISNARSNYNSCIKDYNRYVRKFPNKQFLSMLGYETIEYTYLEFNASADAPTNLFED